MARTARKSTKKVESKEVIAAIKAFKASSDVEGFYTYIHENGLRAEAHQIMEVVLKKITPPKKRGRKKMLQ